MNPAKRGRFATRVAHPEHSLVVLESAVASNDDEMVRSALKWCARTDLALDVLGNECSPLVASIEDGQRSIAERLLEAGAELNLSLTGIAPSLLMTTAAEGSLGMVKLLLGNGAPVNFKLSRDYFEKGRCWRQRDFRRTGCISHRSHTATPLEARHFTLRPAVAECTSLSCC
jgi:hypothetical protein